jgi:hypothetical protein
MLPSPISITVGSDSLSFRRVNQDNYTAAYYAVSTDGLRRYNLSVKHTLPQKTGTGESHLVRLDVEEFDTDTKLVRSFSTWTVFKTSVGLQDSTKMVNLWAGLEAAMSADTNAIINGVLLRES